MLDADPERPLSQLGDVWCHVEGRRWYMEFCWAGGSPRFSLARRGIRAAPWWAKDRVVSVRYRPDTLELQDGMNPHLTHGGVLTVFWARPRQSLGPYPSRSVRLAPGEYFKMVD